MLVSGFDRRGFKQALTENRPINIRGMTSVCQAGLILAPFCYLFGKVFPSLVSDWYTHSSLSYGFLVPFVSAYLVWQKRSQLRALPIPATYSRCLPLLLATVLFLIGQVIADAFIMAIAMVLAVIAVIYLIFGPSYTTALLFPLFYLALMIPAPYALVKQVVNFLMFFDAALTEKILQLLGVPIFLELNFLHLPNTTLEVADVCSGISSIFSLFVLGAAYAYLLPLPIFLKLLLTASTVPLAILVNLFRIIVTVLMTYQWGPVVLESWFHKAHGTFNFLLGVIALIAMGEALRTRFATRESKAAQSPDIVANLSAIPDGRRWKSTGLCLCILLLGIGVSEAIDSRPQVATHLALGNLPQSLGAYTVSARAWPDVYRDANADGNLSRFYASPGGKTIELFIGYRGFSSNDARLNSPKLMFPELWNYIVMTPIQISVGTDAPIQANLLVTQKGPSKRLVLYWYQLRETPFIGELDYRMATLKSTLLNSDSPMMVVRMATALTDEEPLDSAESRLKELAPLIYRELNRLIVK
jgi:EpsI family protein